MSCVQSRACFAGPMCSASWRPLTPLGLGRRRLRLECSSSAECTSTGHSSSWAAPGSLLYSLPQRLAAGVQRAAAAIHEQRAAASETLHRLLGSSCSSTARQRLGMLLSAAAVATPVGASGSGSIWADLTSNYVFVVGFWGWFLAQFLKIFTKRYKTGVWDIKAFVDSGGMPSSHSALCSSVTTAIAMSQGLGSPLFAVSLCFSVIVMYDAMGVRRHAGLQAEVLNVVAEELLEDGHPMSERKLKEVLGHTPRQVCAGAFLGVLVGLLFPFTGFPTPF